MPLVAKVSLCSPGWSWNIMGNPRPPECWDYKQNHHRSWLVTDFELPWVGRRHGYPALRARRTAEGSFASVTHYPSNLAFSFFPFSLLPFPLYPHSPHTLTSNTQRMCSQNPPLFRFTLIEFVWLPVKLHIGRKCCLNFKTAYNTCLHTCVHTSKIYPLTTGPLKLAQKNKFWWEKLALTLTHSS